MKIYARVYNDFVAEIIQPAVYQEDSADGADPTYEAGDEIPIKERFHPDFVAMLVDVTTVDPLPEEHWLASQDGDKWTFTPNAAAQASL